MDEVKRMYREVMSMASTQGPFMLGPFEAIAFQNEWVDKATIDDLDALFRLIPVANTLNDYEPEWYDEVMANMAGGLARRDPEAVASRLSIITGPFDSSRSLVLKVMESIMLPECYPWLSTVTEDFEELSDDDALTLVWALSYSRAPDSVALLESLQSRLGPKHDDTRGDLPTCISVARERSDPAWTFSPEVRRPDQLKSAEAAREG